MIQKDLIYLEYNIELNRAKYVIEERQTRDLFIMTASESLVSLHFFLCSSLQFPVQW